MNRKNNFFKAHMGPKIPTFSSPFGYLMTPGSISQIKIKFNLGGWHIFVHLKKHSFTCHLVPFLEDANVGQNYMASFSCNIFYFI